MKKLITVILVPIVAVVLLSCSGGVPSSDLNKVVETEYFTYEVNDSWTHEERFGWDYYFLAQKDFDTMDAPALGVQLSEISGDPCETLAEQQEWLEEHAENYGENAELLFSEKSLVGSYAAYFDEVKISSDISDSEGLMVKAKTFFVAPDTVAIVSYSAMTEEYGTYQEAAQAFLDSIKVK